MTIIDFYHAMGHFLIIVNLTGYVLVIFPSYRDKKISLFEKMGTKLWIEQIVTVLEIGLGIVLIGL